MPAVVLLTLEEFLAQRSHLPEEGRWCELVRGQVVELSPPDPLHGGIVLNLAKALGEYAQRTGHGYACFDLGLVVARNPDTMRLADVAYYVQGPRFEQCEPGYSELAPAWVIGVVSSPDRRQSMAARVEDCLCMGVQAVWMLDTEARHARLFRRGADEQIVLAEGTLSGDDALPGFACAVGPLFEVPRW